MARMIPAQERINRARKLIQKAREIPPPADGAVLDLSYMAAVRETLQEARDLIKFIPYTPSASTEMKAEVAGLFETIDKTQKELLHR
ncbi:MAG TPA: hypothetical protein VIO36_01400 [Anaerolineaceae bacterium]